MVQRTNSAIVWQFVSNLLNQLNLANIPYKNKDQKVIDQHSSEAWKYRIITSVCILLVIFPFNL